VTKRLGIPRVHAAELFLKAHDFALFSEEEEGVSLTKGHLACEEFDASPYLSKLIDFKRLANLKVTDICSEFSAQCLLLTVAHVIDDINDDSTSHKFWGQKALKCLSASMAEIQVLGNDMSQQVAEQVTWLALNVLIALRDDQLCFNSLTIGDLQSRLKSELVIHDHDNKTDNETISRIGDDKEVVNPLYRVCLLAAKAESFEMWQSAKNLFSLCVQHAIHKEIFFIGNHEHSIGSIQRKIIHLASKVDEVVNIFESIDKLTKRHSLSLPSRNKNANAPYSKEELDYFVIEAHNRAISLLHMGDRLNAEKLLVVALNLLPSGSKEVGCHGAEIRKVYRGVLEKRSSIDGCLSTSCDNVISLFAQYP